MDLPPNVQPVIKRRSLEADRSPVLSQRLMPPFRLPLCGIRARGRQLRRSEAGYTLVELLVATMLAIIVFGVLILPMISGPRVAKRDINRGMSIQDLQSGLYRMTRELRQAHRVSDTQYVYSATSSTLDLQVASGGMTKRVLFACDYQPSGSTFRQCVRAETACSGQPAVCPTTPSAGNGKVIVDRVLNGTTGAPQDAVFTYTPSGTAPTYVSVRLIVPASRGAGGGYKGGGYSYRIYLDDGVYMRNLGTQ